MSDDFDPDKLSLIRGIDLDGICQITHRDASEDWLGVISLQATWKWAVKQFTEKDNVGEKDIIIAVLS